MSELLPDFIRQRIEQEIEAAFHPKGMSTHDGRTRIYAVDAQRLLHVIDHLEQAALRFEEKAMSVVDEIAAERDMRSAMSMAALLLNGATWRKNGREDVWVMTAIYQDGRVAMTRERDGFSCKFAPHVIAEQFSRRPT